MEDTSPKRNMHNEKELRLLFKHLILYLVVITTLKILNMIFIPFIAWSQLVLIVWTFILATHLVLFFVTTGVIGTDYEGKPVKVIAQEIWQTIKLRNQDFKNSIQKPKQPPSN